MNFKGIILSFKTLDGKFKVSFSNNRFLSICAHRYLLLYKNHKNLVLCYFKVSFKSTF